jgi:hypothetical protein
MFKQIQEPTRTFGQYVFAREWALKNARDYCHPYQGWQVVRRGERFAVAVYSKNTGHIQGYAN